MLYAHEMDNIQYDLTHIKKILHQQLVIVCCGREGRNHFFVAVVEKTKALAQSKISSVEILHAKF